MLLISYGLYAFRAGHIPSTIRFSLIRLLQDKISNKHLGYVNICTGVDCLTKSSNCLRIASVSPNKSAKAINLARNGDRATRHDLYGLNETDIEL